MAIKISKIEVHAEKCVTCLQCQLNCSFLKTNEFNPSAAHIIVERLDDAPQIGFTEECDECGVCARYCMYGALVLKKGEAR